MKSLLIALMTILLATLLILGGCRQSDQHNEKSQAEIEAEAKALIIKPNESHLFNVKFGDNYTTMIRNLDILPETAEEPLENIFLLHGALRIGRRLDGRRGGCA